MAMGYKRIKSIADRHGIASPETLAACERWGGILDDVNYPDTTCRWCGKAVTHTWEAQLDNGPAYIHTENNQYKCWDDAPAVAAPFKLDGTKSGRMSNTNPDYGVGGVRKPLTKKPYRKLSDSPQA